MKKEKPKILLTANLETRKIKMFINDEFHKSFNTLQEAKKYEREIILGIRKVS